MGYATIVAEIGGGRYTVELDFGEAQRVALIATINAAIVEVDTKIVEATAKVAVADAAAAAQLVIVQAAGAALAAEANNLPPGSPVPDAAIYNAELAKYQEIYSAGTPRRIALKTLKRSKENLIAKRTQYTFLVCIEQRNAWCCDYTEEGTGQVATLDIPGESDLILIAPGCRAWVPNDGEFKERDLLSPEQCYYNAAILPTWQKYMPTYRWGTLTFIDHDTNTVNLTLGPAHSSAVRIDVNQRPTLAGVQVQYLFCNSRAFEVGDNVVVQFIGQNFDLPVVIGFLDTPRRCNAWDYEGVVRSATNDAAAAHYFSTPNATIATVMRNSTGVTAECRFDAGAWFTLTNLSPDITFTDYTNDPEGELFYDFVRLRFRTGNDTIISGLLGDDVEGFHVVTYIGPEATFTSAAAPYKQAEFRFTYQGQIVLNFSVRETRFEFVAAGVRCLGTYNDDGWSPDAFEILATELYSEA